MSKRLFRICLIFVISFFLLVSVVKTGYSTTVIRLSIEDLTMLADASLIGKVVDIKSRWVDKQIYTNVTISVERYLKRKFRDRGYCYATWWNGERNRDVSTWYS